MPLVTAALPSPTHSCWEQPRTQVPAPSAPLALGAQLPGAGLAPGRSVGQAHRANACLQPCSDAGPDTVPLLCYWQHWPPPPCLHALINELPCADEAGSAKGFFCLFKQGSGSYCARTRARQGHSAEKTRWWINCWEEIGQSQGREEQVKACRESSEELLQRSLLLSHEGLSGG